ncbi:MAG TPA: tetratricopeptide repeat protein, partial [Acidimicrobiia bacterium]|nr:tetratricopeptide repeat protein [Acidimicrobiia bacterium]
RLDIGHTWFLVVAGVLNLLAVGVFSGITTMYGFQSVLIAGGYLLVAVIVVAVLVAMGATGVVDFLLDRIGARADGDHTVLRYAAVMTLAAAVVVPSLLVHRRHANLRAPVFADSYGQRVLDALPEDAVLVVWGEEFSMPMQFQRLVNDRRPDVSIVSANSLGLQWSREQLTDRYGLGDALRRDRMELMIKKMIDRFEEQRRPVYFDTTAMRVLAPYEGYRTEGLVGKAVDGNAGAHTVRDVDAIADSLQRAERADGYSDPDQQGFVSQIGYAIYGRAHIELAKAYALRAELPAAVEHLRRALALNPDDTPVRDVLASIASASDAEAAQRISTL